MTPAFVTAPSSYSRLGEFDVGQTVGVGEWALEHQLQVMAGRWSAWLLADAEYDDFVGAQEQAGMSADEVHARFSEHLVLLHESVSPQTAKLAPMQKKVEVPIHAASFTFADWSMAEVLNVDGDDGFYDHLDGVHGPLSNGRGLHIKLGGDGRAIVWSSPSGDEVFVELA